MWSRRTGKGALRHFIKLIFKFKNQLKTKMTDKMTSNQCDCPFCPLIENKLNQCDIRVVFKWKKDGRGEVRGEVVSMKGIDEELKQKLGRHLITLCLFHRNNHGLKKGQNHKVSRSDYEYCIKSLPTGRGTKSYDFFKICSHTH